MNPRPPIIIIGMHRSGTSMIVRSLQQLGLFAGWRKEHNDEALFFLKLNDWMLNHCGAAWDNPSPFARLLEHDAIRALFVDRLRLVIGSPQFAGYLGLSRYLKFGSPWRLTFPWGWKDPRNTYTLPLWLDLFPDAKVINICRHGIDVAQSLKARQDLTLSRASRRPAWRKRVRTLIALEPRPLVSSLRCTTIDGGLSLWREYMSTAQSHVDALGDRALSVSYEEVLEQPLEELERLADFAGLSYGRDELSSAAAKFRADRAYAFRKDPNLVKAAGDSASLLGAYGY
jgi:hypothetical protein